MTDVTLEKAKLYRIALLGFSRTEYLEFQFNPTSLEIVKEARYIGSPSPYRDFPQTEYAGGEAATFSLDLVFDSYALVTSAAPTPVDVRVYVNKLMALMLRHGGGAPQGLDVPYLSWMPVVSFVWGKIQLFRAVVTKVSANYVMFSKSGRPTRVICKVIFQEKSHLLDFLPPPNPSSRVDPRQTRIVQPRDRLDLIAAAEYHDPRQWRRIAEGNNIDDPFSLSDGQILSIPAID